MGRSPESNMTPKRLDGVNEAKFQIEGIHHPGDAKPVTTADATGLNDATKIVTAAIYGTDFAGLNNYMVGLAQRMAVIPKEYHNGSFLSTAPSTDQEATLAAQYNAKIIGNILEKKAQV
jgi:hypothetical protein